MWRKIRFCALIFLLLSIVLSGCSNSNTSSVNEPTDTPPQEYIDGGETEITQSDDSKNSDDIKEADYSTYNLYDWQKTYSSPQNGYEIDLLVMPNDIEFSVRLFWGNGVTEHGVVPPGVPTLIEGGGTTITIDLNDDGTIHVNLDDCFEEDLLIGSLYETANVVTSRTLGKLTDEERFKYLCEIETHCSELMASDVINNPNYYCDGTTYRFPGEVAYVADGMFLLRIKEDSSIYNDHIVCFSDYYVHLGEQVCVYGEGIGAGTYTKGEDNFQTLALNVGYILRDGGESYDEIGENLAQLIYGDYSLKEYSGTPYILESEVTIDGNNINGRPYTVESVKLDFAYSSLTNIISGTSICVYVSTTSRRGAEVKINFDFSLDGKSMRYSAAWDTGSVQPEYDTASYYRAYK